MAGKTGHLSGIHRREVLAGALAAGAALIAPRKVFATPQTADARTIRILEIARREVARVSGSLWQRDLAAIADFGVHSSQPRFHFANLENGTVRSFRVAHGTGSDVEHDGWLKNFSNVPGSHATSRGAYVTWNWYTGRYGPSMRLGGLDPDNSNCFERAIVMHSADYARDEHVERWGRLGRSNGCFVMGPEHFGEALWHLSGGRLIFADRLSIGSDGTQVESAHPQAAPQEHADGG